MRECTNCVNCDYVRGFMVTCRCSYDEIRDGVKWHVQRVGDYHKSQAKKCEHYSEKKEDKYIHCPSCGIGFGYKWECYPTKENDYSYIQYCYGCGQKIDWSEVSE